MMMPHVFTCGKRQSPCAGDAREYLCAIPKTPLTARLSFIPYGPQLKGVSGAADLSGAAQSLTGTDNSTALAISQSPRLSAAVATSFLPLIKQVSGRQSTWQALLKWPGWGSVRRVASSLQKNLKTQGTITGKARGSSGAHDKVGLGLSVGGLGLTTYNALTTGFPFSNPQDQAYSIYTGLGFTKYTSEIYSGLAKLGVPGYKNVSNPVAKFVLGEKSADLAKSPLFATLGVFYYGAGAVSATTATIDSTGDWIPATLNALQAAGNAGNAVKPILTGIFDVGEGVAEDIAGFSSVIGLIGTVGYWTWQGISDARQNAAFMSDSTKFLQNGLGAGFNPTLAGALADPPTASPTSVAAALQQYATAYNTKPGQLLSELNSQPLNNSIIFLNAAGRMPAQPNGLYAPSGTGNGLITLTVTGKNGQQEAVTVPYPLISLAGLKQWADAIFGPNRVG